MPSLGSAVAIMIWSPQSESSVTRKTEATRIDCWLRNNLELGLEFDAGRAGLKDTAGGLPGFDSDGLKSCRPALPLAVRTVTRHTLRPPRPEALSRTSDSGSALRPAGRGTDSGWVTVRWVTGNDSPGLLLLALRRTWMFASESRDDPLNRNLNERAAWGLPLSQSWLLQVIARRRRKTQNRWRIYAFRVTVTVGRNGRIHHDAIRHFYYFCLWFEP